MSLYTAEIPVKEIVPEAITRGGTQPFPVHVKILSLDDVLTQNVTHV